jgi:hypothetical protein
VKRVLLFVVAMALVVPMAQADIVFDLDYTFSSSTPGGTFQATIADTGLDEVTLTMAILNPTGVEFVSGWYFNINLSPLPALGDINFVSGTAASSVEVGANLFQADGDGKFDLLFNFPTSDPGKFTVGTSVYTISATGLTAAAFNVSSEQGGGEGTYYSAAHVQGIGPTGALSGWIGADDPGRPPDEVIPEPASIFLLGTVLAGVVYGLRKRQAA